MSQNQSTTLLAGVVLFAVGLLSLIFMGNSGNFLGIFPTSTTLQIAQMVVGAIAVLGAFYEGATRSVAAVTGLLTLAVAVLGVFTVNFLGLTPINSWNILLHAVVGIALVYAWLGGSEYPRQVASH
jgi:hypothetical protein